MDVGELIRAVVRASLSEIREGAPLVSLGEQLTGKIQAQGEDGVFLVDFGKFQASARIAAPVRVGEAITVEVVETGTPLKFKMVDRPAAAGLFRPEPESPHFRADVVKTLIEPALRLQAEAPGEVSRAVRTALKEIAPHLQVMAPDESQGRDLVGPLRTLTEDSGLFFEKKLETILTSLTAALPDASDDALAAHERVTALMVRDLKPVLLRLLAAQAGEPAGPEGGPSSKELVQTAGRVLARLEGFLQAMTEHERAPGMSRPLTYSPAADIPAAPEKRLARALRLVAELPAAADLPKTTDPELKEALERLVRTARRAPDGADPHTARRFLAQHMKPAAAALAELAENKAAARETHLDGLKQTAERLSSLTTDAAPATGTTPSSAGVFAAVTYPLPLARPAREASLRVFYRKKRPETAGAGFRISLLLEMERLGGIRADFHQSGKQLALAFFTEREQTREMIEGRLSTLKEILAERFEGLSVTVRENENRVAQFERESDAPPFSTGINLRI